jgi:hypothetical protein
MKAATDSTITGSGVGTENAARASARRGESRQRWRYGAKEKQISRCPSTGSGRTEWESEGFFDEFRTNGVGEHVQCEQAGKP